MAILRTEEANKLPTADVEIGYHPERLALELKLPTGARVHHHLRMTAEEKRQGYVRPLWHSWQHALCGEVQPIRFGDAAREFARNPQHLAWKGLQCRKCRAQVPIGPSGYAFWVDHSGRVTPVKVGT